MTRKLNRVIQKDEYLKALEIVEQYRKQLELQAVRHCETHRETVDEWINKNNDRISGRLIKCLQRIDKGERIFTYMDEVNKRDFMKIRSNGYKAWSEL